MFKAVTVVDDFYGDPRKARALALERGRWVPRGTRYSHETENTFYTDDLVATFERLAGEPIHVDPTRMGFGAFAFYPADSEVAHTTHFDDTDYSVVIYLVPNELCQGGLSIYRHKQTGLDGPPTEEQAKALGYTGTQEFLTRVYFPDKLRPEAWEETAHVSMRFNRLVLLRGGRLFHRASSGFGAFPEDGRLTQRFFFDAAEEARDHA